MIFSFFSHAQAVLDCENVPKSNHLIVCTYLPRFIAATQNANYNFTAFFLFFLNTVPPLMFLPLFPGSRPHVDPQKGANVD